MPPSRTRAANSSRRPSAPAPRRRAARAARSPRRAGVTPTRWRRFWNATPLGLRLSGACLCVLLAWAGINWVYHVVQKPSELLFPLDGVLLKTPNQTWQSYGHYFREHATGIMQPELLAALAQVEASGNPVARTYWRFRPVADPFEVYRPASSAVGLFQITDATFEQARRYCIRDHRVVERGPWNDPRSCWFNDLYLRVLPGDSIELTSAYLDQTVRAILARNRMRDVPLVRQQQLAALVHLCGAGAGNAFARRGLRLEQSGRCGDHGGAEYVTRVQRMQRQFEWLSREES